jgi:hypothetical protein
MKCSGPRIALTRKGIEDAILDRCRYVDDPRKYFIGKYQRVYRQLYTHTCKTISGDKVTYRISLNGPVTYSEVMSSYTRDYYRNPCIDYDYIGNLSIAVRHKLWIGKCKSTGDHCECRREEDKSPSDLIETVTLEIGGCVIDVLDVGMYPDIINSKVSYNPYQTNIPLYIATLHRRNLLPISRIYSDEIVLTVDCVEGVFPCDIQLYGSCYYTHCADNMYIGCQLTYQYQYSEEVELHPGINEIDLSFCNPMRSIHIHDIDMESVTYIGLFLDGRVYVEGPVEMFEHYKTVNEDDDDELDTVIIPFSNEFNDPDASVNFSHIRCVRLVIHRVPGIYWVPEYHACECDCGGNKGVSVNEKENGDDKDDDCDDCLHPIKTCVKVTISALSYQLVSYREGHVDLLLPNPPR